MHLEIVVDGQAVENIHGGGPTWGLLQMPFEDSGPGDIPIQFSKQYYALMQVSPLLHVMPAHKHNHIVVCESLLSKVVTTSWSAMPRSCCFNCSTSYVSNQKSFGPSICCLDAVAHGERRKQVESVQDALHCSEPCQSLRLCKPSCSLPFAEMQYREWHGLCTALSMTESRPTISILRCAVS